MEREKERERVRPLKAFQCSICLSFRNWWQRWVEAQPQPDLHSKMTLLYFLSLFLSFHPITTSLSFFLSLSTSFSTVTTVQSSPLCPEEFHINKPKPTSQFPLSSVFGYPDIFFTLTSNWSWTCQFFFLGKLCKLSRARKLNNDLSPVSIQDIYLHFPW